NPQLQRQALTGRKVTRDRHRISALRGGVRGDREPYAPNVLLYRLTAAQVDVFQHHVEDHVVDVKDLIVDKVPGCLLILTGVPQIDERLRHGVVKGQHAHGRVKGIVNEIEGGRRLWHRLTFGIRKEPDHREAGILSADDGSGNAGIVGGENRYDGFDA